jgi:hypothetical protein
LGKGAGIRALATVSGPGYDGQLFVELEIDELSHWLIAPIIVTAIKPQIAVQTNFPKTVPIFE